MKMKIIGLSLALVLTFLSAGQALASGMEEAPRLDRIAAFPDRYDGKILVFLIRASDVEPVAGAENAFTARVRDHHGDQVLWYSPRSSGVRFVFGGDVAEALLDFKPRQNFIAVGEVSNKGAGQLIALAGVRDPETHRWHGPWASLLNEHFRP